VLDCGELFLGAGAGWRTEEPGVVVRKALHAWSAAARSWHEVSKRLRQLTSSAEPLESVVYLLPGCAVSRHPVEMHSGGSDCTCCETAIDVLMYAQPQLPPSRLPHGDKGSP
jgi:hypothetical protein